MASKVLTTVICDLHEDVQDDAAVHPYTFSVQNSVYTIDLCDEHSETFTEAIAPFVEAGRRMTSGARSARSAAAPRKVRDAGPSSTEKNNAIREWARAQGHEIGDRGRIRADLVAAYEASL